MAVGYGPTINNEDLDRTGYSIHSIEPYSVA